MERDKIKIVFTDLDRTLLRDDNAISEKNLAALKNLKEKGIITVIATGRNIFSFRKVLNVDLPFSYLMFSSGCGIMDWKTQEVIYENHLIKQEVNKTLKIFLKHKVDFMLHEPVPENHRFQYKRVNMDNIDFERRIKLYKLFANPLKQINQQASQFIAILKPGSDRKFEEIKNEINFLKVIRATSPLDHKSIWLEVFPNGVSKGHSAEWLCKKLGIEQTQTISIGNDFNDIDLLEWTAQSYVVENSPEELKKRFLVTKSNEEDGFAEVVEKEFRFDS